MLFHRKARVAMPVIALLALGSVLSGCSGSDAPSPVGIPGHAAPTTASGPRTTASYRASREDSGAPTEEQMRITRDRLRKRAAALGLEGTEVRVDGAVVSVVAPGRKDAQLRQMAATARLEFRPVLDPSTAGQNDLKQAYDSLTCGSKNTTTLPRPERPAVACDPDRGEKYLLGPTAISAEDIDDATARFDSANQMAWIVGIGFTDAGTTAFAKTTGTLAEQTPPANQFAILVDGVVLSAPSVATAITGGKAEISGSFTEQSAENLAANISSGALPVKLTVTDVTVR